MASGMLIVTGQKELDHKLSELTPKLNRQYASKSLRKAIKEDQDNFKEECPERTGAMKNASIIRTIKGLPRGTLGIQLVITRKSLKRAEEKAAKRAVHAEAKRRAKASGRKIGQELEGLAGSYLHQTRDRGDQNAYYPIFIEIGTKFMRGLYVMTRVFERSRDRKRGILIDMIRTFVYDQNA